jgi:hypothetical protein
MAHISRITLISISRIPTTPIFRPMRAAPSSIH